MPKIIINGLGRIGRALIREMTKREHFNLVAVNDVYDIDTFIYLLKYDSVHGVFDADIQKIDKYSFLLSGKKIFYHSSLDLSFLSSYKVDFLVECSGVYDKAFYFDSFLDRNVKKVILAFVPKDNTPLFAMEVNSNEYKGERVFSNSSCTSNCLSPVLKILNEFTPINRVFATTIHSYNADQNLLDNKNPSKDIRKSRSSTLNLLPIGSGIAYATEKLLPFLNGKIKGYSVRVPIADVTMIDTSIEFQKSIKLNDLVFYIKQSVKNSKRVSIFMDPIVSCDIIGSSYSSLIDLSSLLLIDNFLKVSIWQDNEIGYVNSLLDMIELTSKY